MLGVWRLCCTGISFWKILYNVKCLTVQKYIQFLVGVFFSLSKKLEEDCFLMLLTWQRRLSALWVCMKNRSPSESSEDKCQLVSETKNSRRVNNCISSWGDCVALCCLLGIEWLQIILMALPSGELISWVMLELRHCMLRKYFFFEDSNLSKNSSRESANVLALCSSSKQFLCCLGHSLACKKPQNNPLFYHLIVWLYRNSLWFWQRCKEMLGFNCGFSNCSKFSLVQLLSPMKKGDPGNW